MAVFLTCLFIILLFPEELACLKCYTCDQGTDCRKDKKETECSQGPIVMDRCMLITDNEREMVAKHCSNHKLCETAEKTCKHAKETSTGDCDTKCCQIDLCNAGSTLTAFHWFSVLCFSAVVMMIIANAESV